MLLGVAEDVRDGGEGTSVATGWLEASLGGVAVVVGCGGGPLVLGAGGLAASAGVVLAPVLPEAGEERLAMWREWCRSRRESPCCGEW